jgi:hypothetical protein
LFFGFRIWFLIVRAVPMIIIPIEMPNGRVPFKRKTAIKRQIAPEGKAPGELKAESACGG